MGISTSCMRSTGIYEGKEEEEEEAERMRGMGTK